MQKLKLLIPFALFIGAFFVACHEDDPFEHSKIADVSFAGRIIDEAGEGVEGALVEAGNESSLTDKNGVFRLKPVRLPAMHSMVTVSKPGYFKVSRPYIVEDDALQTITIQLLAKTYAGSLNPGAGGIINVMGGPKLDFPANAFTDANGNAYNGDVIVYARYLDPSDPNLALFVPGDMTAENAVDEEVFLSTYGMLGVEIESNSGQKLKIAPGKEVEVRMPILSSQLASAPAVIPLWHYDLEDGHWKEDGSAQKIGGEYVGKVTHFSFWNCDEPFPLTQLHGKIYLGSANQPLANACVRLTMLSTGGSSFGYTDGSGCFGGCIPKDEVLLLEVVSPQDCGNQVYYSANVGPFSGVSTLPDIIIPPSAQLPVIKVSGTLLDCTALPVGNGYVKIEQGNEKRFLYPNSNGQFEYVMAACNNDPQTGQIVGYDLTNLLESAPAAFSTPPNTVNVGSIVTCTTLSEYIQYNLDGQNFTKISPYAWTNSGLTTQIGSEDSTATWIGFTFDNNEQTGLFPLTWLTANNLLFDTQLPNTLITNVTTFGANQGDLIIGTFGGNFQTSGGASHTINGSYRVIRE
ncbi:MAG: carboxypeptidase-like regulatory domain-containing protein [Saprospiraceae bacterium]